MIIQYWLSFLRHNWPAVLQMTFVDTVIERHKCIIAYASSFHTLQRRRKSEPLGLHSSHSSCSHYQSLRHRAHSVAISIRQSKGRYQTRENCFSKLTRVVINKVGEQTVPSRETRTILSHHELLTCRLSHCRLLGCHSSLS